MPTACCVRISGPGYAISIHGGRFSRRLDWRFNHITEGLVKATACHKPETSLSLAVQPSSACLHTARDDKVKGYVHTWLWDFKAGLLNEYGACLQLLEVAVYLHVYNYIWLQACCQGVPLTCPLWYGYFNRLLHKACDSVLTSSSAGYVFSEDL